MATIAPWHSRGGDVYHIRDDCGMGNTITPERPDTRNRQSQGVYRLSSFAAKRNGTLLAFRGTEWILPGDGTR